MCEMLHTLGHYQRYMTKLANVGLMPGWKTALSTIQNDCFTSSLIRNLYHFATDFNRVLLQLLGTDIENSLFKYRVSYCIGIWQSWLQHFNGWWKAVKNLICYSCIFNLQLHVHLKKWTLKFKLLYLRNCISYFNKICSVCCVNTHIQSLKVWLKFVLSRLKYSIFSMGLFLLAHHVYTVEICRQDRSRVGVRCLFDECQFELCSGCVRAVLCAGRSTCDRNLMRFDCIFRCYIYLDMFIVKRSRELT